MMQHKRSFVELMSKRVKADVQPLSSKEKKGIYALQQLISPYGKTDTASVLADAMDYIEFLHEQVKVLSAPYLYSTAMPSEDDFEPWSLKAKGLCLVPVSPLELQAAMVLTFGPPSRPAALRAQDGHPSETKLPA